GAEAGLVLVRKQLPFPLRLLPEVVDGRLEPVARDRLACDVRDGRVRVAAAEEETGQDASADKQRDRCQPQRSHPASGRPRSWCQRRSEEHTSELQSLAYLVCRLLLEKKKKTT